MKLIVVIIAYFQERRSVKIVRPNSAVLKIRLFNKSENENSDPAKSYDGQTTPFIYCFASGAAIRIGSVCSLTKGSLNKNDK